LDDRLELLRQETVIRVEKADNLSFRFAVGRIPCRRLPAILLCHEADPRIAARETFDHFARIVCRAIVAYDHFKVCIGLAQDALDCFTEVTCIVTARSQHGNERVLAQRSKCDRLEQLLDFFQALFRHDS
jgi:hypothetical protein